MQINSSIETISAIATAPGQGGVGIVRVSGPLVQTIAKQITGYDLKPRYAHYGAFLGAENEVLDYGISLLFVAPNSFTGEDVLELQAHGGPVVLNWLLQRTLQLGARLAKPGEFSQQAFLNDKLDLAQAEAIADLISASSEQAAKSALRSMQGEFSTQVNQLVEELTNLRIFVEAAIDFPEEEIDFLSDGKVSAQLDDLLAKIQQVFNSAQQGSLLREGMSVVILGRPNAGKSSLLNALAGQQTAIVTDIAGTTRDIVKEQINLNGMPLHILDTAGLRETDDQVEQIGIERAWQAIENADHVLVVVEAANEIAAEDQQILDKLAVSAPQIPISLIRNKIDLINSQPGLVVGEKYPEISLSAKHSIGMDLLKNYLTEAIGFKQTSEGVFMARKRHLDAIEQAFAAVSNAKQQLEDFNAGELVAEELRLAQNSLAEITGKFSSDDLLGRIFTSFCIGK